MRRVSGGESEANYSVDTSMHRMNDGTASETSFNTDFKRIDGDSSMM
jgi:hypothetical protein